MKKNVNEMRELEILDEKDYWEAWHNGLSNFIKEYYLRNKNTLNILEAGCGRQWVLDMNGINYVLTGVDISKEALELRKYRQQDLHKIILGDLTTIELNKAQYDVVYCSYVLEHINGAKEVLDKFFTWLKPNGLVLLLIPDRNTLPGFLTRITPHGFHIFFYKYLKKEPNAGKPGYNPFPTYHDKIVSRQGIYNYCKRHGYKILGEYGSKFDINKLFGVFSPLFGILFKLIELISFRKLNSKYHDILFVIEKSV